MARPMRVLRSLRRGQSRLRAGAVHDCLSKSVCRDHTWPGLRPRSPAPFDALPPEGTGFMTGRTVPGRSPVTGSGLTRVTGDVQTSAYGGIAGTSHRMQV